MASTKGVRNREWALLGQNRLRTGAEAFSFDFVVHSRGDDILHIADLACEEEERLRHGHDVDERDVAGLPVRIPKAHRSPQHDSKNIFQSRA